MWSLPALAVSGFFAARTGVPGFRHDWIWPSVPATFVRMFLEGALSAWNPHGLGAGSQIPSLNPVYLSFAVLGYLGVPARLVLFVALFASFIFSALGIVRALFVLRIPLDLGTSRALGLAYAFGPICFQKDAAGHIFWLAAYSALPWFSAAVYRGCTEREARSFAAAALLFAFSTVQVQFMFYDAFVAVTIAAMYARSARAALGVALIFAVGGLHNADALLAPSRSIADTLNTRLHATEEWERGMSASLGELMQFSGYMHYDQNAVPSTLLPLYRFGRFSFFTLAVVGFLIRWRDRRAVIFAVVALGGLFAAAGWDGPFKPLFSYALHRSDDFIVFREFFHSMALYAFGTTMLVAMALSSLPPRFRSFSCGMALAIAALLTLPFSSGGLVRMVPSVTPDPLENEVGYALPHLRALLPYQEPIREPGDRSAGLDPARLSDDVATAGDPPLIVRSIVDQALPYTLQATLLADVGIDRAVWRVRRQSALSDGFEPGVGASFAGFRRRNSQLHTRFAPGVAFMNARPMIGLSSSFGGPIACELADASLPNGRRVPVRSSYTGNDIRRQWVSGRLWSWMAPKALDVSMDPVFTESKRPLDLLLAAHPGDTVYALAVSAALSLNNQSPRRIFQARGGTYRWDAWALRRRVTRAMLTSRGFSSVADVIVSRDPAWHPAACSPALAERTQPVSYSYTVPWTIRARIPPHAAQSVLTFARVFSRGWELRLDGRYVGPAQPGDGIFNAWRIPRQRRTQLAEISFAPQRSANAWLFSDVTVSSFLLVLVMWPRRPRHHRPDIGLHG